jgi:hypothetical protein
MAERHLAACVVRKPAAPRAARAYTTPRLAPGRGSTLRWRSLLLRAPMTPCTSRRPSHARHARARGRSARCGRLCAGAACLLLASCSPAPKHPIEAQPVPTLHGVEPADAAAPRLDFPPARGPAPDAPAPAIRFADAPATAPAPAAASVEIAAPRQDAVLSEKQLRALTVRLNVKNWPTRQPGASVLLALDTFRPRNVHAPTRGVRLTDLVDEDATLKAGGHELVAMLAHPSGETLKPSATSPRPFARVRFWVGARDAADAGDAEKSALLVYNLPRGTYNGEAASSAVLLDFYVLGATLGKDGERVRVSVSGDHGVSARTTLSEWRPLIIQELPSGDYAVRLEFVGADGKPVAGRRTAVERTITVNRDAPSGKRE